MQKTPLTINQENTRQQIRDLECDLKIAQQTHGPEDPEVGKILLALSNAHSDLDEINQQKILLERALVIFKNEYGDMHILVAKTLGNLGNAYGQLENINKKMTAWKKPLLLE